MGFFIFEWLWLFFLPPWGLGFYGLILLLSLMVEQMDEYMFPIIASYLIGLHYEGYKLNYVFNNPSTCICVFLFYIFVGILWSFIRLYFYIKNNKDNREPMIILTAEKYRIYGWIMYWPFSLIHSLCGDLVKELLDMIFNHWLKNIYL